MGGLLLILALAQVRITVDTDQAPELKDWAEKAKRLCEEWYPKMSEYLATPGFTPPKEVTITFVKDKKGVADTSGNKIKVAADWVTKHPEDTGMIVHELVHVVQSYPGGVPAWVTDGVADYIRYFQYEKKSIFSKGKRGRSYKDSYRTTASFFAWLVEKHDKEFVKRINEAARTKKYKDDLFKEWTGKELDALWKDYVEDN
jgi:hypothetical protein